MISRSSFFRFLLVGGSATLLHYSVMWTLLQLAPGAPGIASAIGYVAGALYNYWVNAQFTFGGGHSHFRSLPRFFIVATLGLGINQMVLMGGVYISLPLPTAQLCATATVLLWNYSIHATWTFAKIGKH